MKPSEWMHRQIFGEVPRLNLCARAHWLRHRKSHKVWCVVFNVVFFWHKDHCKQQWDYYVKNSN